MLSSALTILSTQAGSFIYHLEDDQVAIGFVCGLDYADPEANRIINDYVDQQFYNPDRSRIVRLVGPSLSTSTAWEGLASVSSGNPASSDARRRNPSSSTAVTTTGQTLRGEPLGAEACRATA